jgi:phage protein D
MPDSPEKGQSYKRRRAHCRVRVGGQDITAKLFPFLISVTVIDKEHEMDECSIEIDDRDALLDIPKPKEKVSVWIGWEGEGATQIFDGIVSDVESGFARKGGGRRVWVEALGGDLFGPMKQRMQMSWGQGEPPSGGGEDIPLSQVLGDIAGEAGASIAIDSDLAGLTRKFWNINESPMHFLERIATEIGGKMKMSGGSNVSITKAGGLTNANGQEIPGVRAIWGENLIGWRVKPFIARPQYSGASAEFFDIPKGIWDKIQGGIAAGAPFGQAQAEASLPGASPNSQVGEQTNGGLGEESLEASGAGWFLINGEPQARAGASLMVKGCRPGVDGGWHISEAEHSYSRASGYQTRLSVSYPPGSNTNYDQKYLNNPDFSRAT